MRLTDAQRRAYAVRERVEAEMQQAVAAELNWLYRRLQMKVRRINQFRPRVQSTAPTLRKSYVVSGDLWEEFRRRMHSSVMRAIVFGAIEIFNINRDFYSTVAPIEFSSDNFARLIEPEIGERIVNIESTLKREVGRKVVGWYNSPGTTMQSLINQLKENVFTDARARMIAQTEVTHLNSRVHENIANQIGATEWWWSTRNDQLVCKRPLPGPDGRGYKGCRELHGKVFKIGQLMPPYASHPNCRCTPIIITPKKQVEEPAKLIEELLAVRKGIHAGVLLAGSLLKVDWEEQKHPRDEDGQFTSKGGGASGGYEVGQKISPQRGKDIYTIMGTGTHSGERTYLVRRAGASKGRYVTESELREKWSLSGEGSKPKPTPKQKWGAKGNVTPRVPPARPADISDNDKRLLREYKKHYKISDTDIPGVFARTQNTPEGTYYHLSREGIKSTAPTDLMNDIGSALYVGRDPAALKEFYGELQGVDDGEVFEFKADDLNILDAREIADFDKIKRDAKKEFPDEKFPVGAYARAHGYDALVYFDPWATGEEFAIFNKDKVTQTGRVSDSAKPEQKPQPAAKPTKSYLRKPKTASEISGRVPKRDGRPVPETTKRVFHVTKRENIEAILQNGFDLSRVKPRWGNDYAVSTTNAPLPKAMEYFMPYTKGAQFDNEEYAVLQVTVKGRFYDYDTDQIPYRGQGLSPQGWTRAAVKDGWDGQAGANMYIYNPAAIMEIKEVDPGEVAAANEKLKRRVLKYTSLQELRKVDWEEQKHPRKNDGKFAPKGQGGSGSGKPAPSSKEERMAAPPNPAIDNLPEVRKWRKNYFYGAGMDMIGFAENQGLDKTKFMNAIADYANEVKGDGDPVAAFKKMRATMLAEMKGKVDPAALTRLDNAIRVGEWRYLKNLKLPPKPVGVKPPDKKPDPDEKKPPVQTGRKMGMDVAKELVKLAAPNRSPEYLQARAEMSEYLKQINELHEKYPFAERQKWDREGKDKEVYQQYKEQDSLLYAKYWDAEGRKGREDRRVRRERKEKANELLKVDKQSNPTIKSYTNTTSGTKTVENGVALFRDSVDASACPTNEINFYDDERDRAYFRSGWNEVHIEPHDSRSVVVHEMGHWLEYNNREARHMVKRFLRERTAGEQAKKLKEVEHRGYGDDEYCKKDKFFHPYCGKIYQNGSTEILSMGLQEYTTDPIKFAKKDKEYFALIYNICHGIYDADLVKLAKADFEENEHPRDEDGKFTDKGTGVSGGSSKEPAYKNSPHYAEYASSMKAYTDASPWDREKPLDKVGEVVRDMYYNDYDNWEAMMQEFLHTDDLPDEVTVYGLSKEWTEDHQNELFVDRDKAIEYAKNHHQTELVVSEIPVSEICPISTGRRFASADMLAAKNTRSLDVGWHSAPEVITYKHTDSKYTRNTNTAFNQFHIPHRLNEYEEAHDGKQITSEEYVSRIEAHLKKVLTDTDICVRVTPANLANVLNDGAYKSVFETGKSGAGAYNEKKRKGYYLEQRRHAERDMFGIDDSETSGRPVYGYIAGRGKGLDPDNWGLEQYGSTAIVLKDSVRERTTFTTGDSLDNGYSGGAYMYKMPDGTMLEAGRCAPSPIDDPKAVSMFTLDMKDILTEIENDYPDEYSHGYADPRFERGGYWEAQISGGFSLDDIKEVVFTEDPPQSTMDLLTKRGIVWRLEKGKKDE